MSNRRPTGFTLIELMVVVVIIGVLASIAIIQYGNMVAKSKESTTKGNLGTIRSALAIYYGDTEGVYPVDTGNLSSLTLAGKYMQMIPDVNLPQTSNSLGHPPSHTIANGGIDDGSAYYYNNGGIFQHTWGQIVVNCLHSDLSGFVWSSY